MDFTLEFTDLPTARYEGREIYTAVADGYTYTVGMSLDWSYGRKIKRALTVGGYDEVSYDDLPEGWMWSDDAEIVAECRRRNRQEVANMREVLATVIDCTPEDGGLPVEVRELLQHKFTFSRKAGCSCGCSPGFKLPNVNIVREVRGWETCCSVTHMWVDRKRVEEVSL